jgi:hypothetical protein
MEDLSVSPDYQAQLAELATTLVTPERFGKPVVEATVELEVPDNIVVGQE